MLIIEKRGHFIFVHFCRNIDDDGIEVKLEVFDTLAVELFKHLREDKTQLVFKLFGC